MRQAIVIAVLLCGACGVDTAEDVGDIACSPNASGTTECAAPPPPPTSPCSDVGTLTFDMVCPSASYEFYTFTNTSGVVTTTHVWSPSGVEQSGAITASTHASGSTCAMNVAWGSYSASLTGVERSGTFGGSGASGIWGCSVSLRSRGYPSGYSSM